MAVENESTVVEETLRHLGLHAFDMNMSENNKPYKVLTLRGDTFAIGQTPAPAFTKEDQVLREEGQGAVKLLKDRLRERISKNLNGLRNSINSSLRDTTQ